MKRIVTLCLMLAIMLPCFAWAEQPAEDYSWLDDLTINQLRALDAEIHKRIPIPQDPETAERTDDSFLTGKWVCEILQDYSGKSWTDWYGHHMIRTYTFYSAGIGNYTSYDATKGGDNGDNYSVTYEVKDEHTVVITSDGFLGSSV